MKTPQYIEKPINTHTLSDPITNSIEPATEGYIRGISLPAMLQLVEMEKKTCTFKISNNGKHGKLHFKDGTLIKANTGSIHGKEAAYEILSWSTPEIEIESTCKNTTQNIDLPLVHILIESARLKDEQIMKKVLTIDEDLTAAVSDKILKVTSRQNKENESGNAVSCITEQNDVLPDIEKMNHMIHLLKRDLGDALLAVDVFATSTGRPLVGYNTQPRARILLNRLARFLVKCLRTSGFRSLGRYLIVELSDRKMIIIMPFNNYQWIMLIDSKKAQLGILFNVSIPRLMNSLNSNTPE